MIQVQILLYFEFMNYEYVYNILFSEFIKLKTINNFEVLVH